MTIQIIKHTTYIEIVDNQIRKAIQMLTGKSYLTLRDMIALQQMGYSFLDIT